MFTTRELQSGPGQAVPGIDPAQASASAPEGSLGLRNPDTLDKGHFSHTDTGFPLARSKWLA